MFLFPLAIALIVLSVANKDVVTFSLNPMGSGIPELEFKLPLFVLLFLVLIIGALFGSSLTWFKQGKHRRALREKSYEVHQLKREKEEVTKAASSARDTEIAPGLPVVSQS